MTTAQTGLAKALARSASGEVIALAELSGEDLMASLSDDQKASLSAALTPPPAPDAKVADPDGMKPGDDDEDADCKGSKKPKVDDEGANASDGRVKAVAAAVAADGPCQGKTSLALEMLADDDFAGLNADALIKLIGKTPVDGANAADADAAARAEMKAALKQSNNSNIDAGSSPAPKKTSGASVWDDAAKINNFGQPQG